MIIENLFYIDIYIDDNSPYDMQYDSQKKIVAKAIDFDGNPVTGKQLTLTVDKGVFSNNSKTYTATTNENGEIYRYYLANEWGLCTFSCDTAKLQIFVHGFKTYNNISTRTSTFKVDESSRSCRLIWNCAARSFSTTVETLDTVTFPKTKYAPDAWIIIQHYNPNISVRLYPDGSIKARTGTGNSTTTEDVNLIFNWHY